MELSCGNIKNTYKTKIDGHIVEIEICRQKSIDYIKIWWSYNNNWQCTEFYYSKEEDKFLYAKITERQAKILRAKIFQALEMEEIMTAK